MRGMSKEQIKAGHDAINKMGIDSINDTAAYNSSSFRQARRTLKGEGRESLPELEARGGRTYSSTKSGEHATGRNAWEERLKKELTNKHYGYMEENFGSRKSKTIFAPKTQNDSSPKLTLNPDVKGSEIGSKKAAEVLNTLKDLAADSSNASKKATDAWQEGEQYTKKLLSKM